MRPVIEGCVKYRDLEDGSIDLEGIDRINDGLDNKAKNEALAHKLATKKD